MDGISFGRFISGKRRRAGLTLRQLADRLGISTAYLSDVEKGRRYAFDLERLRVFAHETALDHKETELLYDLAGQSRGQVSPDINEYLYSNSYICAALRTVRTLNADAEDWKLLLDELKKRKGV